MIRPATLADLNAILEIATRETARYPQLIASKKKLQALAVEAISSARNFCWVSCEDSGSVTGVLAGFSSENTWAERQNCLIMLWTAEIVGDGVKMLREFRQWLRNRRAIRVAGFAPDLDTDPRVWRLVERLGFKRNGGAYLLYN